MASIKKTPNGSYQATVYIGRDANGKQLFKYVTKPTLRECKAAAREIEQEKEEGKLTNIGNIRVAAWIEQYLEDNNNSYASGTIGLYKIYLRCHWKPFFKQMKLKDINDLHINKLKNELLGKMKSSTARRIMGALSKILKTALKDKSPTKDIKLPKANPSSAKAPSTEEFIRIHTAVNGTRYEIPVLCAGWCGFRREEIFAIRPDDLDFQNGTIRIDEAYAKNDQGQYEFGPPKSENGYRTIKAPSYLMNLFKKVMPKTKVVSIKP
ncbi:site-specific integrase, partial [bacterium]